MSLKPRVLVVDDDPYFVEVLQLWFRKGNCEAVVASHGEEAFRILNDSPDVDVVLTDFMMPELNGIELVRRVKSTSKLFDTKIVVMSNNADPEFRKRAAALGASAYWLKTDGARAIAQRVMRMIHSDGLETAPAENQAALSEVQTMQQSLLALIRMIARTDGLPDHARTGLSAAEELAQRLFQPASPS